MLLGVLDFATGTVFLVLGVAVLRRSRVYAALSLAAGVAWFLGDADEALVLLHRPLIVQAALAAAAGRVPALPARVLVVALWMQALAPAARSPWVSVAIGAGLASLAFTVRESSPRKARRDGARLALASTGAALVLAPVMRSLTGPQDGRYALGTYTALLLGAGVALLSAQYRLNVREVNSIIELSDHTPDQARQALIGLVEFRRSRRRRSGPQRALELLEMNVALQDELEARLEQVRASRARLLDAATEERRRLEGELDRGAMTFLNQLREVVEDLSFGRSARTRELSAGCVAEVDAAKDDLAQLARGLHPRTLTERGLAAALEELVGHAPLPVLVQAPLTRFAPPVETVLWYACAEALTNLIKHSQASGACVSVEHEDGHVTARVTDDGVGGARAELGGGLAGLADRLASVDGFLRLQSPPGRGTDVLIRVPVS